MTSKKYLLVGSLFTMFAIASVTVGIVMANINTAAADNGCIPKIKSFTITENEDDGLDLRWMPVPDCYPERYHVYLHVDDGSMKVASTPRITHTRNNPPDADDTKYLAYTVKPYMRDKEYYGMTFTVRGRAPAPDIDDIKLVCWYEHEGRLHSVAGANVCTKAEIQRVLSE